MKTIYTPRQLDNHAMNDLLNDAKQSEAQSINGPFFPELGITADSLKRYAAECRATAEKHSNGGLHDVVINSKVKA